MIVADAAWGEGRGLRAMVRSVAFGVGAVDPGMFGVAPVPNVRRVLHRAGLKLGDVERIEINAFAAVSTACQRELGFADDVVNVKRRAIAHVIRSVRPARSSRCE
jgi:acetyl-CoA C-acetyltransferase